jgi:predicted component of type VI protein secretion system
MAERTFSAAPEVVTLHLLDSAQGHPVQTWRFKQQSAISIGRSDDNDVVIADAHVSRTHVKLTWQDGAWTLSSTGRHGTLVSDRVVAETQLGRETVFRLGASGPTLRFEAGARDARPSETIDSIHPDLIAMLEIDRERQQQEADDIASNSLFRELQDRIRRSKHNSTGDTQIQ